MSTATISPELERARESARNRASGQFGHQSHTRPELTVSAPVLKPYRELMAHQFAARDDVLDALLDNDRVTLVSACGSGKTLTLHGILEESGARKVAAFFPSLYLVDQAAVEWASQYGGNVRILVVCSDDTVAESLRAKTDENVVSDEEFAAIGATVIRDVEELSAAVLAHQDPDIPLIVFSTYQSSAKVAQMQAETGFKFEYVVVDEAHRLASKDRDFATNRGGKLILDADAIVAEKRIFATATPRTYTYKDGVVVRGASMDDTDLFGPIAHTLSLRDAIDIGRLTPYQVNIVAISEDAAGGALDGIDPTSPEGRMVVGAAATLRAQRELGAERIIAYLGSVERAEEFAEMMTSAGAGNVFIITGDMPAGDRKAILDRVGAEGGIIANVRCLTEGVDLPALDAVAFIDPRSSKIDIVQAVGRATRTAPGKEVGHVILPVFDRASDEGSHGDGFDGVWAVLGQMADNDSELREQIMGPGSFPTSGSKREREEIVNVIGVSPDTAARLAESIKLRAADIIDRGPRGSFYTQAARAAELYNQNGRLPRQTGPAREKASAQWLLTQRQNIAQLTGEKVALLDGKVPGWRKTSHDTAFEANASQLGAFVKREGRLPDMRSADPDERKIAVWRSNQLSTFKRGQMSEERETFLNDTAPGWGPRRAQKRERNSDAWVARAKEVVAGRTDERTLANNRDFQWVYRQRKSATVDQRTELARLWPEWETAKLTFVGRTERIAGR